MSSSRSSFELAKKEIAELLLRSALHFEFGVVFSDRGVVRFPTSAGTLRATRKNKGELREFVVGMLPGGASCVKDGLLEAIQMVKESTAGRKIVLYVGDGGGTCSGNSEQVYLKHTLSEVAQANDGGVIIHCMNSRSESSLGSSFLEKLSEPTGGRVVDLPSE